MNGFSFIKDKRPKRDTVLDNVFITRYMPHAPEIAVKAYLYGLMLVSFPGEYDGDIASALGCEGEDILSAFTYWESLGLVALTPGEKCGVVYLDPAEALVGPSRTGAKYGEFVGRLQGVLGTRVLSGAELSKVYDWLDIFGFEQDAALLIVKHCLDKKGARTKVSYMDAVARTLSGEGALTCDAVREHFEYEALIESGAGRICRRWHRAAPPTEDELALYEKWTRAWGFDEYAIDAALSKMVSANKPSFAYLDGILADWHEKGSADRESIEAALREEDAVAELARQAFKRAGLKRTPDKDERSAFAVWYRDWCMSAELILFSADIASKQAHPFAAMKRILNDWHEAGLSSVGAAAKYEEGRESSGRGRGGRGGRRALNYIKGAKYTDEQLKKLGISMGEEFYEDEQ